MFFSIEDATDSSWFQLLVGVSALIGVALAIYFYSVSRRYKDLVWTMRSINLIEPNQARVPGFKASFDGDPIETLTITRVMIWNRGKEPITSGDIASLDPLRIELIPGARVLSASVLSQNSAASRFAIDSKTVSHDEQDHSFVILGFEFIDHRDGLIVEVLHTSILRAGIRVSGRIIGNKNARPRRTALRLIDRVEYDLESLFGSSAVFRSRLQPRIIARTFLLFAPIFFGAFMSLAGLIELLDFEPLSTSENNNSIIHWFFLGLGPILVLAVVYFVFSGAKVPRGLERFIDPLLEEGTSEGVSGGTSDE